MATHDYVINDDTGANVRTDLNAVLSAIASNNSSATEPATTFAYQFWADTANDSLKQRNAANSAWISILTLSTGSAGSDTSNIESRLKTSELRIAGLNDAGINSAESSFADAYTSEAGVDTGASTNEIYNATNNFYGQPRTSPTTSYQTGDRTGRITVTTNITLNGGNITNWVDGGAGINLTDAFHWDNGDNTGEYVKFQFATAKVIDEARTTNNPATTTQANWKWQGSDDDISYTDIGVSYTWGAGTPVSHTQLNGNTTAYLYYKLLGTGGVKWTPWEIEIEFKESDPPTITGDIILISNTVTAETEPTTVEVLLVNEPVGTVTLNTDLTMEVSIDGGATYDAVTLVDKGLFATGQNLLRGSADVTARTGTSIKYKLTTLNTKEQNQIGIVLAWS